MQGITREKQVNHDGKFNPSFFIVPQETCSPKNKRRTLGSPAGDSINNLKRDYKKEYKKFYEKHPNYFKEYYKTNRNKIILQVKQRNNKKRGINVLCKDYIPKEIKKNKHWKYRQRHPEKIKLSRQRNKAMRRNKGELSIKTIQQVYEDNIKQYGTLTCIYCLKPIEFRQDHLEHKIPLSRGGSNEYDNLAIACYKCNLSKSNKTEEEYINWRSVKCSHNPAGVLFRGVKFLG